VKTLLAGPSPTSPMRRRLPTPLFPTAVTQEDHVGNREQYETGNSTVTPVVSNLRIDPDLSGASGWVFTLRPLLSSSVCSIY
jgi:hypothetical protein